MMTGKYYTGRFFAAFLIAALFGVFALLAGVISFEDANIVFLLSPEMHVAKGTSMATTGFVVGIFGGGTAVVLAGWYLARK